VLIDVGRLRLRGKHQVAGQGEIDVVLVAEVCPLCVMKVVQSP